MQKKERSHAAIIAASLFKGALSKAGIVALLSGSLGLVTLTNAMADDCAALGGTPSGTECQINGTVTPPNAGPFRLNGTAPGLTTTLHILSGGIDTNGQDITILANQDIILEANTFINANGSGPCPGGKGGDITLTADADQNITGDVNTAPGSKITSNSSCSAGAIVITGTTITVRGDVKSVSTVTGIGVPGGGPITIDANCDLTVLGMVTSKGIDPGADRVHLEGGCNVKISGMVESTGGGHAPPSNPPNHCYDPNPSGDLAGNPDPLGAPDDDRLDKPQKSAACVEVWAGDSLLIDGEINADLNRSADATSWVDLFARGNIQITGGSSATDFAVHANGKGGNTDNGGLITVISTTGNVSATGFALQADSTSAGSDGGKLTVHAFNSVNLNMAKLSAQGDSNPQGGLGKGGEINVRAFHMSLIWTNGDGNVEPAATGTISLIYCTSVNVLGTGFHNENPVPVLNCVGEPTLPKNPADSTSYVLLPDCICVQPEGPCVCIDTVNRDGNLLTLTGNTSCSGGFLGNPAVVGDEITLVGFSATCESNPTCRATVKPATRTNTSIQVTVPVCAVPGNFVIVGLDATFPNPRYTSFSCFKEGLPTP